MAAPCERQFRPETRGLSATRGLAQEQSAEVVEMINEWMSQLE
jgi:hypothetical protein